MPCSMRKFVKSVHGLQQAANGENIAYNTAAKMPRGQARQRRRINHIKDHNHPQLAAIVWSEGVKRNGLFRGGKYLLCRDLNSKCCSHGIHPASDGLALISIMFYIFVDIRPAQKGSNNHK